MARHNKGGVHGRKAFRERFAAGDKTRYNAFRVQTCLRFVHEPLACATIADRLVMTSQEAAAALRLLVREGRALRHPEGTYVWLKRVQK